LDAKDFARQCAALGCEGDLTLEGEGEFESREELSIRPGEYNYTEYELVWQVGNQETHKVPLESKPASGRRKTMGPGR
jgi:hypothetical protein